MTTLSRRTRAKTPRPTSILRTKDNRYTEDAQRVAQAFRAALEAVFKRNRRRFHPDQLVALAAHQLVMVSCRESLRITVRPRR